jgi:hypothetical protein
VYSPGNSGYHSVYQPVSSGPRPDDENPLPRNLFIAVAVLGLASYVFSFGPVVDGPEAFGWDVRFAALAALCAMLGVLAKQNPLPLATAVLATMGFLEALSNVLAGGDPGWALTVIVVLNALQAVAAVAALLLAPKGATKAADTGGYEAYVDYYNQAVRSYYGQQQPPAAAQRAGYGQAYGDARASAPAQRSQRPSQHGDYADLDYSGTRTTAPQQDPVGSANSPTGLPSFGHASSRADEQLREADDAPRPSSSA